MKSLLIFTALLCLIISSVAINAALLADYIADPVDNRPAGRYRFSMFCLAIQQDFYGYLEPAVAILGGSTQTVSFSADFHLYFPERGRWEEISENRASFAPRHSMVSQPLYLDWWPYAELFTQGGFKDDATFGLTIVDDPLTKITEPENPYYPVDGSWLEPWVDTYFGHPGARARSASFVFGSKAYVTGGITADGAVKGDLWEFATYYGYYTWYPIYQPLDVAETLGSSNYFFGGASASDIYGGGSFNSNSYAGSTYYNPYQSYSGYNSNGGYNSYGGGTTSYYGGSTYYYGSASGSTPPPVARERRASVQEHDNDHELVLHERHYEQRQNQIRVMKKQQQQQQQVNAEFSDEAKREADAQSFGGPATIAQDASLFRYGACCAALTGGPSQTTSPYGGGPSGIGTGKSALCFGGTGKTSDYRSVLKFTDGNYWWTELSISNANDGPKPGRDMACSYNENEGVFVVFGGYDSRIGSASSDIDLYFLNVTGNCGTWYSSQSQKNFTAVYGQAMCTTPITNKTYMYGGKSTFATNATLFELDFNGTLVDDNLSNSFFNISAPALVTLPTERAFHIAASTGTAFFVGFGRSLKSVFNDFWSFDLLTNTWTSIRISARLTARWGATAATLGTTIFIFGGRAGISATNAYNDLTVFETGRSIFSFVDPSATAPAARSFHVSFESNGNIVVGLGQDTNAFLLDDWHAFSPVSQSWRKLTVTANSDKISARLGASAVQSYNSTHSIVGLGYNSVGLEDWYFVQVVNDNIITKRIVIKSGLDARITRRSFASVSGRGRHILVCGGMQTLSLAAPPDARCYQFDAKEGLISATSNKTAPVGLVGAPAVYVKDSIFTFGGQVISDPTVSDVFYQRIIRVRPNATCNVSGSGIPDDTNCSLCGFGSSGLNCEFTPAGSYTSVEGTTVSCAAGTYSSNRGGSSSTVCLPCPFGTFGNTTGLVKCYDCNTTTQFCPIGSASVGSRTSELALLLGISLPQNGLLQEINPGAFETPPLPWFPVGLIGASAIILAALIFFFLWMNNKINKARENYYMTQEQQDMLGKIYKAYSKDGQLVLTQLILVFSALQLDVSPIVLQKAFEDQVDQTGREYLSKKDFKKVFMDLIRAELLPPFEGSNAEKDGHELPLLCSWFGGFKLSALDSFRAVHIPPELGQPRRVIQTWYGGVFTILLAVSQVILILAILVNFLYSNIQETKAIVPYPVVQAAFGDKIGDVVSDLEVTVGITGPIRDSTRYNPSDDKVTRAKKVCIDIASGACNNETKVTATGVTIPVKANEQYSCSFEEGASVCSVTWRCVNCTVVRSAELLFQFAAAQSANRIDTAVKTSTGIHDVLQKWTGELKIAAGPSLYSEIREAVVPSNNKLVFSGFPATTFHFGLSPTYFESVELKHVILPADNLTLDSGYHLRPDNNPTRGNSITPEFFGTYYDAPVKVVLKTDAEIMYVRRQFIQSIIDLVSSLLGALSGVAGVYLALTNYLDGTQGKIPLSTSEEEEGADDNKSDDDPNAKSKSLKKIQLPGQESGDFTLTAEPSMATNEDDTRRILPLVSLGLSVDVALKYQTISRHKGVVPPAASDDHFDLGQHREIVKTHKSTSLAGVREVEVDATAEEAKQKQNIHKYGEAKKAAPEVVHEERTHSAPREDAPAAPVREQSNNGGLKVEDA